MLIDKIVQLKQKTVKFANLVEMMILKSLNGLMEKNETLLYEVINTHEDVANELEVEIDEMCIGTIALFHPGAKDLRIISMISKINNDLERIGDLAANIADSSLYLIKKPPVKPLVDIPRMGDLVIDMLKTSITCFIEENTVLAYEVLKSDDTVDDIRDQIFRELITYMLADSSNIERSMHLLRISRNLERIADLTTNISEDVIFIKEGKFVKHTFKNHS